MYTIELDIAHDCPLIDLIKSTKQYDISIKLITEHGPSGGNPIYAFFGQHANLIQFCNDNFNYFEKNWISEVK